MLVVGGDGGFHFLDVAYTVRHPPYFKVSKLKDSLCPSLISLMVSVDVKHHVYVTI